MAVQTVNMQKFLEHLAALEKTVQNRRREHPLREMAEFLEVRLAKVQHDLTDAHIDTVLRLQGQAVELKELLRILTTDPITIEEPNA